MNRKDRLKITNTPDKKSKSKNIYQQIDNLDEYEVTDHQMELNSDFVDTADDSLFNSPESTVHVFYSYLKKSIKYLQYFVSYGIIIYFVGFYFFSKIPETNFENLTKEIDSLKQASAIFSLPTVQMPFNLCKIEHCTTIHVKESDLYKYGLLGFRKSSNPYVIFNENVSPGECLAFLPSERELIIKFSKEVNLDNFNIFHPETGKKESAVKDFSLVGFFKNELFEIGQFTYDISKTGCQTFNFPNITTDRLIIKILNNNGNKFYTTIYKIYVLGIFN